jgi:hypothetical protein
VRLIRALYSRAPDLGAYSKTLPLGANSKTLTLGAYSKTLTLGAKICLKASKRPLFAAIF